MRRGDEVKKYCKIGRVSCSAAFKAAALMKAVKGLK